MTCERFHLDVRSGTSLPAGDCLRVIGGVRKLVNPGCLSRHGGGYMHAVFHPASRFWAFQGIETGLFAGTAILLIVGAAWWTNTRTT